MIRSPGRAGKPRITLAVRAVPAPGGVPRHRPDRRSGPAGCRSQARSRLAKPRPPQASASAAPRVRGPRHQRSKPERTPALLDPGACCAAPVAARPAEDPGSGYGAEPRRRSVPRCQALHQDLGFLVCRPSPTPHRTGDHLDPTIRLTLMPALITALMPAVIHRTARPVASASVSEITGRCRKVAHSHRLPLSGARRSGTATRCCSPRQRHW